MTTEGTKMVSGENIAEAAEKIVNNDTALAKYAKYGLVLAGGYVLIKYVAIPVGFFAADTAIWAGRKAAGVINNLKRKKDDKKEEIVTEFTDEGTDIEKDYKID